MKIAALTIKGPEKGSRIAREALCVNREGGVAGDAQGVGARQISFLSAADARAVAGLAPQGLCTRRFFANVLVEDLDRADVKPGDRLRIRDAVIRVTRRGKDCFPDDCPLPGLGLSCPLQRCLFGAVETGGVLALGDPVAHIPSADHDQ